MNAEPRTYDCKIALECKIQADVYRPEAAATPLRDDPTPVIVHIHGGCLIYGSRKGIQQWQLERYLLAGYTVVSIDYRLAPETKLPAIIEDLDDALSWVAESGLKLYCGDASRIAVVGHSAGGYLALMSGFATTIRPKAIVSFYGYGDIIADWYSRPDPFYCSKPTVSEEESGRNEAGPPISEPYEGRGKDQFYLYCRQNGLWPLEVSGHDPHTESEFLAAYCPEKNTTSDYPPTLLLHGDQDTDVPYEQSTQMHRGIQQVGGRSELITMSGHGHGFDYQADDPEVQRAFASALEFLDTHLK